MIIMFVRNAASATNASMSKKNLMVIYGGNAVFRIEFIEPIPQVKSLKL